MVTEKGCIGWSIRTLHKTALQCFFSLRLRLFCLIILEGPLLYEHVWISFWTPEKAYGTHSFQQSGIPHLSYGLHKKVTPFVCFEPVAFMIYLMPLCPYTGKQWLIILYLPLHYHDFIDIIKVIYLPGWRVLACLISSCMEAPHLNHLCYLLLHLF